jgi:CubicO group peptidase (beta-lactamase class C family)
MRREIMSGAVLGLLVSAASPVMALPAGFKAKADALLAQSYGANGPGASVVISEHGRIVYQGVRGMADVAAKRPITPSTVFRIGSITKQFSSAVVLQLAAEGKIKLDDPLSKYLPAYPNGSAITVRQLLNHTSGIQSYTGIPGWMVEANTNKAYTTEQLIGVFKDQPAPSKPGEKWDYNNSGYVLVGALIEAVTGNKWSDEVEARIARPLRLASLDDGVKEASIKAMAGGYTQGETGVEPARKIHMSVPGAAGALVANAADLARWGMALHHGKVVPASYYAQMIAPTTMPDGKVEPYGFGIGPGKLRGLDTLGHSGGIFGFASDSLYVPSSDTFIAILTNSDNAPASHAIVMRKLAAMAIGKPYVALPTVAYTPEAVKPYLGVYKFETGERTIALRDGKLTIWRNDNPPAELFAGGGNRFHYGPNELSWLEIRKDSAGKAVMAFHGGGEDVATLGSWSGPPPAEVAAFPVPAALLASYAGNYSTPIGKAAVAVAGTSLTIALNGPALPVKPVGPADFTAENIGAKIHFLTDSGKVTGFEILQGGRTLPAKRD